MTTNNMMRLQDVSWGLAVLVAWLAAPGLQAQSVSTIISSNLNEPNYITCDPSNKVYITDSSHNRIVKFDVANTNVSVLVGGGKSGALAGTNDGISTAALFSQPLGMVYDAFRKGLVVVDQANQTVRLVTNLYGAVTVTTLAGVPATLLQPNGGTNDGPLGTGQFSFPVGIASDNAGNLYIADAGNNEIRVLNAANVLSTIVLTNVLVNGVSAPNYSLKGPAAVAFDPATRNLYIADTLHQTIGLITNITSLANTMIVIAGTPGVSGTADSSYVSGALFDLPRSLFWDTNGMELLISDTGNNTIRQLTGSLAAGFSVQTIAGMPPPALSGNLDGLPLAASFNQPVGLAVDLQDGGYYVADRGNSEVRSLIVIALAVPPPESLAVAPPTFSPDSGFYLNCVTITVNAGVPDIYYTTDGSAPTVYSPLLVLSNNPAGGFEGSFQFCDSEQSVSAIQMFAVNGTNSSTITYGKSPTVNTIGTLANQMVGAGSTAVVPILASLITGHTLRSVQFRFEIATNGNAPMIPAISLLPINTNNFIHVNGPAAFDVPFTYETEQFYTTANNTQGLILSAGGTNNTAFFLNQNYTILGLVEVPIPANAVQGQSYTVSILNPSGTSDGIQKDEPILADVTQTLTVSNLQYFVGDSSPGTGYSAGQFGDGVLKNNDVNNALLASVGILAPFGPAQTAPYPPTDVFNAMDAFPPDTANSMGGDGLITMLDWETILVRSLGLDTNNWVRFWSNSAAGAVLAHAPVGWTNGGTVPIDVPHGKTQVIAPPGQVWVRNATFYAGSVSGLTAGATATIPVSVTVQPGSTLAGMQFRAILSASAGAPAPGQTQFTAAAGIPNPAVINGASPADIVCVWPLPLGNSGGLSLQGANLIGSISFTVPAGVSAGQSYSLHFVGVDGAPDFNTLYQLESVPGTALVGSGPVTPQITSDEWRMHFFGSLTSPQAQDNADPDGDGVPNWQEYLAGTDPTNPLSCLQLIATAGPSHSVNLGWLTAPGKNYVLESSATPGGTAWAGVSTVTGDGNQWTLPLTNHSAGALFYRIRLQQ